jgi:PAS domain S-box-containing protein
MFVLLTVWVFGAGTALAQRTVRVGVYQFPPLVHTLSDGRVEGLYIDLLEAVAKEEGWKLEYVTGAWAECLDRLKKGDIDLQTAIAMTSDRQRVYDFSRETVVSTWGSVYTAQSGIESPLDLQGRSVAVLRGDVYNERIRELLKGFNVAARFIEVDEYDHALEMAGSGRVDAAAVERFWGVAQEGRFAVKPTPIVFSPLRLVFAAPKGRGDPILPTIDHYLNENKNRSDSVYYRTLNRWTQIQPAPGLPQWLPVSLGIAVLALALIVGANFWLRHLVRTRTRELQRRNQELEAAIQARQLAETEARENAARFQAIVEKSEAGYYFINAEGIIQDVNEAWLKMYKIEHRDQIVGEHFTVIQRPEDEAAAREFVAGIMRGDPTYLSGEFSRRCQDGSTGYHTFSARPVLREGRVIGIEGFIIDSTQRHKMAQELRASLKDKEVLLKEIHHRVKNNMQVVSSLLSLQAGRETDPRVVAAFEESQRRVSAMALVHESLYRSPSVAEVQLNQYVDGLVHFLAEGFSGRLVQFQMEITPDLKVGLDQAIPCGLVLNELITNAARHAYPDQSGGAVRIEARQKENGWIEILVRDWGRGLPPDLDWRKAGTLGLSLVRSLVERQLLGSIEAKTDNGAAVTFTFPLQGRPAPPNQC